MTGVRLITPRRFMDERGWFAETYSERAFARETGLDLRFVQDNHSYSRFAFTLRGLHFQRPPFAQAKLVRCVRGRILDVVVDLRRGSPTFGRWVGVELDAVAGHQIFVPVGFGHGFLTLEPETEVLYKVSDVYAPESEGGVRWNDPEIAVDWRLPAGRAPLLSGRDVAWPGLADVDTGFGYDGTPLTPLA